MGREAAGSGRAQNPRRTDTPHVAVPGLSHESPLQPNALEHAVRCGLEPERLELLYAYLRVCDEVAAEYPLATQLLVYQSACDVLLDAICDDIVPRHWRIACLDNLAKPLLALRCLARNKNSRRRVEGYFRAARTLSHYFLQKPNTPTTQQSLNHE